MLSQGRRVHAAGRDRAVLAATEGLLFFRLGLVEKGRCRYERIIEFFGDKHEGDVAAVPH